MKISAAAFFASLLCVTVMGEGSLRATVGQHLRERLSSSNDASTRVSEDADAWGSEDIVADPELLEAEQLKEAERLRKVYSRDYQQVNAMLIQSAATEASLRKLSAACRGSALYCNSLELDSLIEEFSEQRAFVQAKFEPINELLGELDSAKDRIATANQLRTVVAISLKVASKIPYVGAVFTVANGLIGPLESPMKGLAKTTTSATKAFATPWSNSVGRISAVTATVQEKIEIVVSKLVDEDRDMGLASLLEGGKCLQPALNTLTGAFDPFVSSVETSVNDLTVALRKMTGVYTSVATTLSSSAWVKSWSKMKSGMKNVIGAVNLIATPLNGLKPLGDLLKKKISINWPKLKFKKTYGVPKYCPSGYSKSKSQLYCLKDCGKGYSTDGIGFCWKDCDNGYKKATKVACKNKNHYMRKTKGRKLKCSWSKGCSYQCDSGYSSSAYGLTCWENCKSGWKSGHALAVAFCYKSCPKGFKLDPTRALCIRNSYNQASKPMVCGSGKESIAGICSDKCPSGWKDNKLFCSQNSKMSFSIQDIADELGKIIDKIEGLPIVKEIKKTIQKLVMKIMDPILSALDLPTVSDLTQKITIGNVKLLGPLGDLADLLEAAEAKVEKVTDALQLPGVDFVEDQKLALIKAMGLPSDLFGDMDKLNGCISDISCLREKLPGLDLPMTSLDRVKSAFGKFTSAFDTDEFEAAAQSLSKAFDSKTMSCDKEATIKIPVEKTIADLLGKTTRAQTPCSVDVTYCSKPNFGSDLQAPLASLRTLMSPAIAQVSSLFPDDNTSGSHASFLEMESSGSGFGKDNFAIPFFVFPFTPPYGWGIDGVTRKDAWGWRWTGKGKGTLMGTMLKTALGPSYITLYAGKKQGKDYISMDLRFKWEVFRLQTAKDHPKNVVQQEMNRFQELLDAVKTDGSMGASHCFGSQGASSGHYCGLLQTTVALGNKSHTWRWDGIAANRVAYKSWPKIMKKSQSDAYWKTTDGKIDVRKVIAFIRTSTSQIHTLVAKVNGQKLTWLGKKIPKMKELAKAQLIRQLHTIPLRWTLPQDDSVAIPSIGVQISSWKYGGAGIEVWKTLTQLDAFDRFKVYLPTKAKYVSPAFKGVSGDVTLILGARVGLAWNVGS